MSATDEARHAYLGYAPDDDGDVTYLTRGRNPGGEWPILWSIVDEPPVSWVVDALRRFAPGTVLTIKTRSGHRRQWKVER